MGAGAGGDEHDGGVLENQFLSDALQRKQGTRDGGSSDDGGAYGRFCTQHTTAASYAKNYTSSGGWIGFYDTSTLNRPSFPFATARHPLFPHRHCHTPLPVCPSH